MRTAARTALAAAAILTLAACAQAPTKTEGGVVTNATGMTLYTFDKDAGGKSMCNGPCAINWPPFMATGGASGMGEYATADARATGDYTVITRDDGSKQWALKGKPLYTWVKDKQPGDKTGDGVNNVWHVATP